jgi:hypothetical protein
MRRSDGQTCLDWFSDGERFHRREGKVLLIYDINALKLVNSFSKVHRTFTTIPAKMESDDI